ncbi:MAG: hypothetical protein J5483_04235 [Lachnospiraceae bacterium]|nr:hypothetical protein [Lachnospiraceae bacterium]
MMMSPETYKDIHQDDSYEELLEERDSLLEAMHDFEENYEPSEPFMFPSQEDVYLFNLQYLAKLCELIEERYVIDIRNGRPEELDPEEMDPDE